VVTTCDECTPPGFARDGWIEGRLQDLLVLPGTHTFFSNRIRRSYDNQVFGGYLHPLSTLSPFRTRNMCDKPCRIAQVDENGGEGVYRRVT